MPVTPSSDEELFPAALAVELVIRDALLRLLAGQLESLTELLYCEEHDLWYQRRYHRGKHDHPEVLTKQQLHDALAHEAGYDDTHAWEIADDAFRVSMHKLKEGST